MLGERRPSWIPSPDDAMARLAGRLPAVLAAVGVIHSYRILSFQWEYLFEWCHQES